VSAPDADGPPDRYVGFPAGFFDRMDPTGDDVFYELPRLVTHIDATAIAAVGRLYERLGIDGGTGRSAHVLDLMSSWISHFTVAPDELTVLGLNADELARNPAATARVVHDVNADPRLPFADDSFDAAVCCVSVDYLVRPLEVFEEVARVLRPGAPFVCTFSNRCFPTKAISGWLAADDTGRCRIVAEYFRRTPAFGEVQAARCLPPDHPGDPLFAVWAGTGEEQG
jgi:SAM-dependent methyltransferase